MNYYNLIRYEFCNQMKWHPVNGDYDRPIVMSKNQFIIQSREQGHEWWNWKCFEPHVLPEAEMIDELEFIHGQMFRQNYDGKTILDFKQNSIQLIEPVIRVAKYNTQKGKNTTVRQYHLPIGNPIDKRIVRHKCKCAYEQIQNGMTVTEALRTYHVKWNSLVKYSDYVPLRSVVVNKNVSAIRKRLMKEPELNLTHLLNEYGMSSKTFWKKTGGKKPIVASVKGNVLENFKSIFAN